MIIYQSSLMRVSQHASVMPYLQLHVSVSDGHLSLVLRNQGIGPAKIRKVSVETPSENVVGDPFHFLQTSHSPLLQNALHIDRLFPGMLVPNGENKDLIRTTAEKDTVELFIKTFSVVGASQYKGTDSAKVVVIEYESIYGTAWQIRSDHLIPQEID